MSLRVGIFGRGRLGGLVADAVTATDDLELAWALGRKDSPSTRADVALDLSHADAVPAHLAWAAETGTDLVIGATGWDRCALERAPASIGVLTAPNFSLSMALLRRLSLVLGRYAARSPEPVDLAVAETHHRAKADAPSGSAVLLAAALAQGAGRGIADIQTASLRLGTVVGRHEVRYESPAESIVLAHEAHTPEVFAQGALTAARWVHGRPGIHTFDDLAADHLAPLLAHIPTQEDTS